MIATLCLMKDKVWVKNFLQKALSELGQRDLPASLREEQDLHATGVYLYMVLDINHK